MIDDSNRLVAAEKKDLDYFWFFVYDHIDHTRMFNTPIFSSHIKHVIMCV